MSQQIQAEFPDKLRSLFQPKRYKVYYGGRGGAKSWGIARALLIQGTQQPLRVLCARELQNSIDESVHQLLSDQVEKLWLSGFYEVQKKTIIGVNGTTFNYEGLRQNVTKIKSYEGVDRVWVEEAEAVSKSSWNILIPTIRKDHSEIWISFNPEFEDDETYERFVLSPPRNSIITEINYRDNPWFPSVLEDERLECKAKDPDSYDHIWEGKCRQWLTGAIYADELRKAYDENRITEVEYDPEIPVYTAWDIGHTDDTAIWWFQIAGGEIHIIESYARSGGSPSHFASQILGKEVTIDIIQGELKVNIGEVIPDIEHRTRYKYEAHWLPHDAKAKTLAAHGKSTEQQLQLALNYTVRITPNLDREDGIKAARSSFHRCWFDKEKCAEGLKALRKYQRDLQRDEVSLQKNPKHDWTSHYADAFRYLSIAWQEPVLPPQDEEKPRDAYETDEDEDDDWQVA